ncbi:Glucan endo-1,3-beta-glucosidase [Linum grandiflorum]
MAKTTTAATNILLLCLPLFLTTAAAIGVHYATNADNLPPPAKVAAFLKSHTIIDRIKINDTNPEILRAFANTGISVAVSIPREQIPSLNNFAAAKSWVSKHITPFHPQTKINYILVGKEVFFWNETDVIRKLVPAMKELNRALKLANLTHIKVSSPHALQFIQSTQPPSSAEFQPYTAPVLRKELEFHLRTKTPFMVNLYPFLKVWDNYPDPDYALYKSKSGMFDKATGKMYTNMLDEMLDAVYVSMKKLDERFKNVEIVIGETGWPTVGEPTQPGPGLENAKLYNQNAIKRVRSGKGTPLMPNRSFETYIFSLFDENLEFYASDKSFGVLKPDFSVKYDAGLIRSKPF